MLVYLVTIAIGLLGLVSAISYFLALELIARVVLLGLISSIFATLAVHIAGRTFFWSHMAKVVLFVIPKKEGEVAVEKGATVTSLLLLHQACIEYIRKNYKIVGSFDAARMWEIELWLLFFVGFSLVWLALSF